MANPFMKDIPAGGWVKINDAPISGPVRNLRIHKRKVSFVAYFHNYRDAGEDPPDVELHDDIMWVGDELEFTGAVDSDFYLLCRGEDGRVRVEW